MKYVVYVPIESGDTAEEIQKELDSVKNLFDDVKFFDSIDKVIYLPAFGAYQVKVRKVSDL